jgi:hypothetical protein
MSKVLDITPLRSLIAIANEGNFHRAASSLDLTHLELPLKPAVSPACGCADQMPLTNDESTRASGVPGHPGRPCLHPRRAAGYRERGRAGPHLGARFVELVRGPRAVHLGGPSGPTFAGWIDWVAMSPSEPSTPVPERSAAMPWVMRITMITVTRRFWSSRKVA